jgi:hypothetical protein
LAGGEQILADGEEVNEPGGALFAFIRRRLGDFSGRPEALGAKAQKTGLAGSDARPAEMSGRSGQRLWLSRSVTKRQGLSALSLKTIGERGA